VFARGGMRGNTKRLGCPMTGRKPQSNPRDRSHPCLFNRMACHRVGFDVHIDTIFGNAGPGEHVTIEP
jgi:hypothetical protein